MAFLPIVERELRLAARRKSTHRIRLWTTVAGVAVSFFFIFIQTGAGGFARNLGPFLFALLTYYAFGLSLLAGVVLAADCISVEKREGTLGLLFLTDLKGYDVVFGKMMAVGLSALCGLVAVLPVTGLPVLMGGVTVAEYGRVALALVNTLFFALATGILISTWFREANRAMFATLVLLALVAIVLPVLGGVLSHMRLTAKWWYFTSFSPFNSFRFGSEMKYRGAPTQYWYSLLASHLVAWFMLCLASWTLPRVWQDKPFQRRRAASLKAASGGTRFAWNMGWKSGRRRLLDENPVQWLSEGSPFVSRMAWGVAWLCVVVSTWVALNYDNAIGLISDALLLSVFGFILKILVAFQACRFFVDTRRDGALQLILSTPLTNQEIIQGQWFAMKRIFLWPVILILTAQFVMTIFSASMSGGIHSFTIGTMSLGVGAGNSSPRVPLILWQIGVALYQIARSAADIFAIGWTGMWFGLSAKKPNLAVLLTFLFAWLIPAIIFCVPNLLIDLILGYLMRDKLRYRLRSEAMPQFQVSLGGLLPPPVIPN